jgi:DNA polymerase III subunit epsilon
MILYDRTFAAIDFETATHTRDSACAVAVVIVRGGRVIEEFDTLIRPPTSMFHFTRIHGIRWRDVKYAPSFDEAWASLEPKLGGVEFFVAHNASFDKSVLHRCCESYRMAIPKTPFRCTLREARARWNLPSYRLPDLCSMLGIRLQHHNAISDARACAQIFLHTQTESTHQLFT